MKKTTLRRIAAGVTASLVMGGFVIGLPEANAAVVTYTCTGATNDVASSEPRFFQDPLYRNSAQTLDLIAASISGFSPTPSLLVNVDPTVPAAVAPGTTFTTQFKFNAQLPASLVTAASGLGLSQVRVTNASFNVNAVGGTPSPVTGTLASKDIPLVTGASVEHTIGGAVTPTGGAGTGVTFKAGAVKLSITLNVQILLVTINTLTLNCAPNDITVGLTAVTGSTSTTAAPTTAAPTTAAPTTAAPTTAAPTTAAPTTAAPTTAAPTTAAPTTAAPTTAAPTTAAPTTAAPTTAAPTTAAPTTAAPTTAAPTTVPQPGVDTVSVRVSGGLSYFKSSTVSGAGYSVGTDGSGITNINGFGTFPGFNSGTGSVTVNVNRFLWWSFGSVNVNDPSAGINSIDAPLIFAPVPSGSKAAASVSANWFTFAGGFKSYAIEITVGDNG